MDIIDSVHKDLFTNYLIIPYPLYSIYHAGGPFWA